MLYAKVQCTICSESEQDPRHWDEYTQTATFCSTWSCRVWEQILPFCSTSIESSCIWEISATTYSSSVLWTLQMFYSATLLLRSRIAEWLLLYTHVFFFLESRISHNYTCKYSCFSCSCEYNNWLFIWVSLSDPHKMFVYIVKGILSTHSCYLCQVGEHQHQLAHHYSNYILHTNFVRCQTNS